MNCTVNHGGFQPEPSQDLTGIEILDFQLSVAVKGPCLCSKEMQGSDVPQDILK